MENIYEHSFKKEIQQLKMLMSIYPNKWTQILLKQLNPKRINDIDVDAIMYALNSIEKLNLPIYTIKTKAYWLLNGITEHPKCLTCGIEMPYKNVKNINSGYQHLHCSTSCGNRDENVLKHIRTTSLELYGTENPAQSSIVKEKARKHNQDLYGVDWYTQSEVFKQQYKETCLDKYGVDNIAKYEAAQQHIIETCKTRYGVDRPMHCREIYRKTKAKYLYENIKFDSKHEIAMYIWLIDHNVEFEYSPNISIQYFYNNECHMYMPDFIIKGQIVEIKGDHFFKEDGTMQNPYDHSQDGLYEAKHQCMIKNNVVILKQKDCQKYIDYVEQTYGKGYLKQFKKKPKESKISNHDQTTDNK